MKYHTYVRLRPNNEIFKIEGDNIKELWYLAYRTARAMKHNNEVDFVTFRIYDGSKDRRKYERVIVAR